MDPGTGLPMAFGKVSAPKSKPSANLAKHARPKQNNFGFGTAGKAVEDEPEAEVALEAPIRPGGSDDEEGEVQGTSLVDRLPISHEVVMKEHNKTVSALALDPSGTRFVSGSYDYDAKIWDFGGMTASFKPFRSFEPKEGHQVHDVAWSNNGDSFLVATGGIQPKMYDRDGLDLGEWVKGDHYIRDLRNTDGHVAAITCLAFHPKNSQLFLTGSEDGTLRLWEVENKRKSKSCIVVKSKERGGRTKVTACAFSKDGKTIAAACTDGTIHLWATSSNFARPNATAENAHEKGTTTSSIVFSNDGQHVATRGGDGTVKLWNVKAFKKPVATATDLPSLNPETNLVFSPDDQFVVTGTAGSKAGILAGGSEEALAREMSQKGITGGKLVVLNRADLTVAHKIDVSDASVVKVLWHPRINQILTGSSDGCLHVLYSPTLSTKGITIAASRAPRARAKDTFFTNAAPDARPILAPHALPMFKEDINAGRATSNKRQRERERHDSNKTMKPMPPMVGPGKGGRIGAAATQHVVQGLVRDNLRDQDPREALLKYATKEGEAGEWTGAWARTQPKAVFDTRPPTDEEDNADK